MHQSLIRSYYYSQRGRGYSEEIAAGEALLLNEGRAYWDFTALSGSEDDAITSVSDLTGNGWNLSNNAGALTPKLGKVIVGNTFVSSLKATTPINDESAMITPALTANLLKGSNEFLMTVCLSDGQHATTLWLMGGGSGSTRLYDVMITGTGAIQVRYAANASTFSTLVTTAGAVPNGFTGIILLRIRFDFVTDVITAYVNGVPYVLTLSSGNALSVWNPDNWYLENAVGIGGRWGTTSFSDDASGVLKMFLKVAVTELLTDDEATNVSLAMLDI